MGVNRHPFVKDKWDERAYFLVQDVLYEGMDDGHVSVNAGVSDLAILAFIRATCSRPGALSKDWFDMSGAIAKWARVGGENVMSVSALTFSRDGFSIELPDGTIENAAQRGEIDMTRIKALYEEAAASGYTYSMSLTPDTVAEPRRAIDLIILYCWRRALFKVQYEGMSKSEIASALAARKEKSGHEGGMPIGARIDAAEAVTRFLEGEKAFLPELKGEPLLVALTRAGGFGQDEMSTKQILSVFQRSAQQTGFKPGSGGVNNLRRGVMVGVQKGAERGGFDPAMHAKKVVNHRQSGHGCREAVYEDTLATTDAMAFLCGRVPQPIESLKNLSNLRVPEVAKFRSYADVPKKDPVQKLLSGSPELKQLHAAITKQEVVVEELEKLIKLEKKPKKEQKAIQDRLEAVQKALAILVAEEARMGRYLRELVLYEKQMELVLYEKQMQVYKAGVAALESMPLHEMHMRLEVNSYEGVTLECVLLRYGCDEDVPFEVESILNERISGKGKTVHTQYLVKWKGYKESRATWESKECILDESLITSLKEKMTIAAGPVTDLKAAADKKAAAIAEEPEKPATELNGAKDDERVDERAAAFWAEQKALLEEVAATVQKATVERAVASSGIPHESKMATPDVAMRVPMAPLSVRNIAWLKEEALAKSFRELCSMGMMKSAAISQLSKELDVPAETIRKQIRRAEKRLHPVISETMVTVSLMCNDQKMEVLCKSDTTLLELQVIVAGRLEQPVSKLRLVSEGERMAASETVASVLLRGPSIEVFLEQSGGGGTVQDGKSQDSAIELSPGRDVEDLSQGGTEVDAISLCGTEIDVVSPNGPEVMIDKEQAAAPAVGAVTGTPQKSTVSSTPIKRPRAAIETDLDEDEEIIAMSLEALKAKLQQVQAEAKIAIASIGAHEHLAQVEDGDGEEGKAEGVVIRAAVDLSLDGEGDNPALAVDLSQDGEGEDGGGERDRRRALPSVVDLAKDGEGDGGGEGDGEGSEGNGGDEGGDGSRYGSFHPNVAQSAALAVMEAGKSVVVISAAGTGKTALILGKVKDRLRRSRGKVLLTGPYNTHVDKLRTDVSSDPELAEAVVARRIIFKTTAAAFSFPTRGIAKPSQMAAQMSATMKALLKEDNLFMVIDESALVSCFKRDATSELLKIVRESNEPDGGLQVLEVQDLMQGEPFHSEAEKAAATVNGVMLKELNVEGEFMSDPNREIVFLHESNRFTGPLKEIYEQGANELRGGGTGAKVQEMMKIAVARNFTPEEDVEALTLYGTSKEVMDASATRTLMRAKTRGHTVENGGVYIYDNTLEASEYSEQDRNSMRPFGFEKLVIAKGERMLLIQKSGVRSEAGVTDDEEEEDHGLQFKDRSFATGNMPCEVVDFEVGKWVKVKVPGRQMGKDILIVPFELREVGGVTLKLIGLKPFMERVVDLAQGLEWTGPVHAVATHIYGRGKFYVAVTRCRDLRMLKISGIDGYASLRRVVKSNWRAIEFNVKQGIEMPASSKLFAQKQREKFDNLIGE